MTDAECMENSITTQTKTDAAEVKEKRKPVKLFGYELPYIGVAMIVFSFFGFATENVARIITRHVFDCRHQLLPFLFAYGIALLALHVFIGTPGEMRILNKRIFTKQGIKYKVLSHLTYFAVLVVCIFVGEIAVGEFYEHCTGVVLWDYSALTFHVTKYTSVRSVLFFSALVYLIMAFGFKPLMKLIEKMGRKAAIILNCTLGVAIVIDFIIMVVTIFVTGSAPMYWSVMF